LRISPNTVRTHIQSILFKLNVHSALNAVALARRAGVVGVREGEMIPPNDVRRFIQGRGSPVFMSSSGRVHGIRRGEDAAPAPEQRARRTSARAAGTAHQRPG
jgi:hypothetical protein